MKNTISMIMAATMIVPRYSDISHHSPYILYGADAFKCAYARRLRVSQGFLPLTWAPPYEKLSVEELLACLYLLVWIRTQQHEEEKNNKCNCNY